MSIDFINDHDNEIVILSEPEGDLFTIHKDQKVIITVSDPQPNSIVLKFSSYLDKPCISIWGNKSDFTLDFPG